MGSLTFVKELHSVKVDNLPPTFDKFMLKEAFSKFGGVGDVFIPWDEKKQPRSYGFVRFAKLDDAEDAIKEMDKTDLAGERIKVQMATSKKKLLGSPKRGRSRDKGSD